MRAEDLKLDELLTFTDGHIDLHGRRLVLHSTHASAQLRKDLIDMIGTEQARKILTRFGFFWGNADAAAMRRIFKWADIKEHLKAGPNLQALHGAASPIVKQLEVNKEATSFQMEVEFCDSIEADEHVMQLGSSDSPVCWKLAGYLSGYATFSLGTEIYFSEHQCRAKGDKVCRMVGKDAASWGDEFEDNRKYFQTDDIRNQIDVLTKELKLRMRELTKQQKRLRARKAPSFIASKSASFRRVLELADRVAPFDSSILITGESGVGKEVVARHIHAASFRSKNAFIAVNCGALPETLLDSELFGHKSGAFTGATHDRIGLIEQAEHGTLFLDEIGEISEAMQIKLLRVLQEREIMRVGESKTRKVDVRIMAATNRNLEEAMKTDTFRDDFYYRLRVIEICVPPLRARREDILPLARFFIERLAKKLKMPKLRMDAQILDVLYAYSWPGNVRELENAIEHAAVLSDDGLVASELLPTNVLNATPLMSAISEHNSQTLSEIEAQHIKNVLNRVDGNKTQAAKILGISPVTLWRKLKSTD